MHHRKLWNQIQIEVYLVHHLFLKYRFLKIQLQQFVQFYLEINQEPRLKIKMMISNIKKNV